MNDFQRLKTRVNLKKLILDETSFAMKKHHLEECPFCQGHDCFSVNEKEQKFKCFQCGESGDCFDFLQKYRGIREEESLILVAGFLGETLVAQAKPKLSKPESLLLLAAKYYHRNLLCSNKGKHAIDKRGHSNDMLEKMKVGWSDGRLADYLLKQGFTVDEVVSSGLVRRDKKKNLYDYFGKDLLIFPHFLSGKPVHFTMKDPEKTKAYQLGVEFRGKKWRFYNQDALELYEDIFIVEGEHDTLTIMDSSTPNVLGLVGQISAEQLKTLAKSKSKKFFLWMDNDFDPDKHFVKGHGYIRKICGAVRENIFVIVYPENYKDPDEYLQSIPRKDRRKTIDSLKKNAIDYISWELGQAAKLPDLGKKIDHLRELETLQLIAKSSHTDLLIYREKLFNLGITYKAIDELLVVNQELYKQIQDYMQDVGGAKNANANALASLIHDYFVQRGRFFRNSADQVFLFWENVVYEVGNNRPFNALMKRQTGLLPTENPGRSTWESVASEAYSSGKQIDIGGWLQTDKTKDLVFLNMNSPDNQIIQIGLNGIYQIPNGINSESVFLSSTEKFKPFEFLPDVQIREAISLLKELFFDNLSCDIDQKYMVTCWLISAFLADYQPHVAALLKAAGGTGSGKTTMARLAEFILYGNEHLGEISVAGAYADASKSPLVVIDNLENQDIRSEMLKFLLLVATRGSKVKRKGGTESGLTQETPKALLIITAIEPFIKAELINRTLEITFEKKYQNAGFIDDVVTTRILKSRNVILSGILRLIQADILPNLDRRTEFITALKMSHKGHAKDRLDSHLAMMMLILEALLKYWPAPHHEPNDIWTAWVLNQDALARDSEVASNDIIRLLDGLMREYALLLDSENARPTHYYGYNDEVFVVQHPEYALKMIFTQPEEISEDGHRYNERTVEFDATSGELAYAFARFCRNNGIPNPYSSAGILGARLKNDRELLGKGNWALVVKKEPIYFKVVRGKRYYRFRHKLIN